jgi:hypothetical protein
MPNLATLRPYSAAAGVYARSGQWLHMGWRRRRGGWDGSLGGPPFGLGCSPYLRLPPLVAAAGRQLWMVKAVWRVERVWAASKAVRPHWSLFPCLPSGSGGGRCGDRAQWQL